MFEITGNDIAALSEDDLRSVIGLLCEAEARRANLSAGGVTWGGDQNAKDGGLDVRVAFPPGSNIGGFIPTPQIGFQVKKPDMPPAKIPDEMKPKGKLRPVIADLAKVSGSYIIVSAAGSTADSALKNRRNAMAAVMKGTRHAKKLTLDFYDRNRVATWVRGHPGMILWVRARIGKAIPGWKPYGAWSHRPGKDDGAYLLDDAARIRSGATDEGDGLSAIQGIDKMRDVLRSPGHVIRLVGLSGVGKTKLVEALFDPFVGTNALDPARAVYADTGTDGVDPQPARLASDLIAHGVRAIMVIDNCQAAVHRQLSDIVRSAGTTLSVITVEYDIREDQPEGTDVFTLDTSSPELIARLIKRRFPHVSQVDRETLAEVSGGNARVALALASTVKKNETVAGLGDAVLFDRLFHQRNVPDAGLLWIAQACSLVYSFDGETLDGDQAEMPVLAAFAGRSVANVFAAAAELKSRHLLQTRGPWRAVLPHAIANRLAAAALERLPRATVVAAFADNAPQRLLRSFSRRLGYLDTSPAARAIVETWLAPGGLLADVFELDENRQAMFGNVAPAAPDAVLSALESAVASAEDGLPQAPRHFIRLLRSLAYEPRHFERAAAVLIAFARLPPDPTAENHAAEVFESLFLIVLSGTHAPLAVRIKVAASLLHSPDLAEQSLGIRALRAMLKSYGFSSGYNFEFGVRSRDYGYHPLTVDDVKAWFSAVVAFAAPLALMDTDIGRRVRGAMAGEFRGLWANAGLVNQLEELARGIAAKGFWRQGWIAAREARTFAGKRLQPDSAARLVTLEEFLRPKDLVDKVRGVVLGERGGRTVDLGEPEDVTDGHDVEATMNRAATTVEALGRDVAKDADAFRTLLPELFAGQYQTAGFGRGLALGADDPAVLWRAMVAAFSATADGRVHLMNGFLDGMQQRDTVLAGTWLDAAVSDPVLALSSRSCSPRTSSTSRRWRASTAPCRFGTRRSPPMGILAGAAGRIICLRRNSRVFSLPSVPSPVERRSRSTASRCASMETSGRRGHWRPRSSR